MKTFLISYYVAIPNVTKLYQTIRGRHGHDRMVVGFTTLCAISAYHH
jgi:hypothetical protein